MPFFYLIFFVFFSSLTQAQDIITISSGQDLISLEDNIEVLVDKNGSMTLNEVRQQTHIFTSTKLPFSAGYTKYVHWFRFSLQRDKESISEWLLSARPGYLDSLKLYSPASNNQDYQRVDAGDQVPASMRSIDLQYGVNTFAISLIDDVPKTFYLRMRTHSTSSLNLTLATPEALAQNNTIRKLILGLILGVIMLVAIQTIMLWRWSGESVYFLFLGYLLGAVLLVIALDGSIPQYLLPNSAFLVDMLAPTGSCFMLGFLTKFFSQFLEAKRHFPRLNFFLNLLIGLSIITQISVFYDGLYVVIAPYLFISMLLMIPCCLYIAWRSIALKLIGGRAIFYGYLIYDAAVSVQLLAVTGVIPSHPLTLAAIQLGTLIFIIFLQQALNQRGRAIETRLHDAEIRTEVAEKIAGTEKQRRKDQSIFMTMVAHEFKTPLAVIDSAIQTMALSSNRLNASVIERHQRIQQSVSHLNDLLENTLTTERTEQHHLQPYLEKIMIYPFVTQVISQTIPSNRRCHTHIAHNIQCTADQNLLSLALNNILVNALKYSPDNSILSLHVDKTQQSSTQGTLFSITNHYESDAKPDCSDWFNKYYRDPNKSNINGFGLGLYLVKKISDVHKGSVTCNITAEKQYWLISIQFWIPDVRDDFL